MMTSRNVRLGKGDSAEITLHVTTDECGHPSVATVSIGMFDFEVDRDKLVELCSAINQTIDDLDGKTKDTP